MSLENKKRSHVEEGLNGLIQRDEYLDIIKRMGIPTASSDTLDADGISPFKLIFNSTLNKLRIFDGTIWKDATPADLSNYYTKLEIDNLFQTVNDNITLLQGLHLEANPATSQIFLKDANDTILSTLSVGFLNNEGATFEYNATENTLDLKDEDGNILSSIPVESFISNVASQIAFNGGTPYRLELKDNSGTVLSTVDITISNIQGLTDALASKEPLITIIPVAKGGTGHDTITENSFFIGGPSNTMVEKTPQEIIDLILSIGDGLDFTDNILKVASVSSARIVVNPTGIDLAQTAVSAGTYTKVTVDGYGRVTAATQATLADFSAIAQSIQDLSTNGIIVKNGTGTVTRTITGTSGRISVADGNGVGGNPTIDLVATPVVPGTYNTIEVDTYGRVINGSNVSSKFVPNVIFVDITLVNSSLSAIERADKPYHTIQAALDALPAGTEADMWTIWMLKTGTHTITSQIPAGRNLTFKSVTSSVLTTSLTATYLINGFQTPTIWGFIIDMPLGEFRFTTQIGIHQESNAHAFSLKINVNTLTLTGSTNNSNYAYFKCGYFDLLANLVTSNGLVCMIGTTGEVGNPINFNVGQLTSVTGYGNATPVSQNGSVYRQVNINIGVITGNQKVTLVGGNSGGKFRLKISRVNMTAEFDVSHYASGHTDFICYFDNATITATSIYFTNQTTVAAFFEGEIVSMSVAPIIGLVVGPSGVVTFRNFKANFGLASINYYSGTYVFEDCNITHNSYLFTLQATLGDDKIKFIGHNTIYHIGGSYPLISINGQPNGRVWIEGTLMGNMSSIGTPSINVLKDPLTVREPKTIFLATTGSDTLGEFENPNRPFLTIQKALEVQNTMSGGWMLDSEYKIKILDTGTYTLGTKGFSTNINSGTNIQITMLRIHSALGATISIPSTTPACSVVKYDLQGINLTIDGSVVMHSLGENGGTFLNNLQLNNLTILGKVGNANGLTTYGRYINYSVYGNVTLNAYAYWSNFGAESSINPVYINKIINNSTLLPAGAENSRLGLGSNPNIIINEFANNVNGAINLFLGWTSAYKGTWKINKITNTGGNFVTILFNSNTSSTNYNVILDLHNGTFDNVYIGTTNPNQPVRITGQCAFTYSVAPSASLVTINADTKVVASNLGSYMLKDLKCKITYPSTPSHTPIKITGVNSGSNQHQIIIEDCAIETSHDIEIFNIITGITLSTDSIIQFRGVNDFKNNKALILATSVVPTNAKFITSRNSSIRHDFNVLSVNTNIKIYDETLTNFRYKTYFVNSVTGNNANGRYQDATNPFATIDYVLALSTWSDGDRIWLQNKEGVFPLNGKIPVGTTTIESDLKVTLDFSANENTSVVTSDAITISIINILLPQGIIKNERSGGAGTTFMEDNDKLFMCVKSMELYWNASSNFTACSGYVFEVNKVSIKTKLIHITGNTTYKNNYPPINIHEFICLGTNATVVNSLPMGVPISIAKISGSGSFSFLSAYYNIGDISTTGQSICLDNSNPIVLHFRNSTITTATGLELSNYYGGSVVITGIVKSATKIVFSINEGAGNNLKVINFSGDIGTGSFVNGQGGTWGITVENSFIKSLNSPLGFYTGFGSGGIQLRNSSFEVVNAVPLVTGGTGDTRALHISGISTNATMLSDAVGVGVTITQFTNY